MGTTPMIEGYPIEIGSCVWAPLGTVGWRPACVAKIGQHRGDDTIVHLTFGRTWRYRHFDTVLGKGKRLAKDLRWRDPNTRKCYDKPKPLEGRTGTAVSFTSPASIIARWKL